MRRRTAMFALLAGALVPALAAEPPGSPMAREALQICLDATRAPPPERPALYTRGLELAERAIAADDSDPKAHFAAFCNRGRQMELAGASVQSLVKLRRLRQDVDRALELAPDYVAALAGKGSLLIEAPRMLGGDTAEGERLLRRAVALAPHDAAVRLRLARALAARDKRDEARTEAERVATDGDEDDRREARALLDRLAR